MTMQKWPSRAEKLHSVKKSITFALRNAWWVLSRLQAHNPSTIYRNYIHLIIKAKHRLSQRKRAVQIQHRWTWQKNRAKISKVSASSSSWFTTSWVTWWSYHATKHLIHKMLQTLLSTMSLVRHRCGTSFRLLAGLVSRCSFSSAGMAWARNTARPNSIPGSTSRAMRSSYGNL